MKRDLVELQSQTYDVLVVGGGIYGASLVREAAAQGLNAALIEQADFGAATSANSLKIIHGGLRYLQQADLPRVLESIRERSLLLKTAPHLVAPFPCLMPTTRHLMKSRLVMQCGLLLNDILSFRRNAGLCRSRRIPCGRTLSRSALLERVPQLASEPVTGAAMWTDAFVFDSERLPLLMIQAAVRSGAHVANYVRADSFLLDESQRRVLGVRATDVLTGRPLELRAALVINASSAWSGALLKTLPRPVQETKLHLALAVNFILKPQPVQAFGMGLQPRGSHRLYFFAPWRGHTIAGTYYRNFEGAPTTADIVTEADVEDFLQSLNQCLPGVHFQRSDIAAIHAGILPCAKPADPQHEPALLRHSHITDHARTDGLEGLMSVCSIKYTTARGVAEEVIRRAARKLGKATRSSPTRRDCLPGGDLPDPALRERELADAHPEWPADEIHRLVSLYGSELEVLLKESPSGSPDDLFRAECLRAIRDEMPQSLGDLLFRRIGLAGAGAPPPDRVRAAATHMAAECGWSDERTRAEIQAVETARSLFLPAVAQGPSAASVS